MWKPWLPFFRPSRLAVTSMPPSTSLNSTVPLTVLYFAVPAIVAVACFGAGGGGGAGGGVGGGAGFSATGAGGGGGGGFLPPHEAAAVTTMASRVALNMARTISARNQPRGSVTQKRAPLAVSSSLTLPPIASHNALTTNKPTPNELPRVVVL